MAFAHIFDNTVEHSPAAITAQGYVINAGFDASEGVQKVASMVWNPSLLQWERSTGSGSASTAAVIVTKRIDMSSSTVIYTGTAEVGVAESAPLWSIKKIMFDGLGNPNAVLFGVGAWADRLLLAYQ